MYGNKKILVVDDSSTDLLRLKKVVSSTGYKVLTATSGYDAIRKAKSEKPSLIFMDIVMDEMDGYKACREISRDPEIKNIPVVFVSSKHNRADYIWAEKQGGKALISKPYSDEQIIQQIDALVESL
ncbi:MAG: response regulator [Pseudomonadota bacterium]